MAAEAKRPHALLDLNDDVLCLVLRRFTVHYAPVGAKLVVEKDQAAVDVCSRLALTCSRISILVCFATTRRALEGLPRSLSSVGDAIERAHSTLDAIRDQESALLSLSPSFGWLSDDTANSAFESSLRRQKREVDSLLTEGEDQTQCLRGHEERWRRDGIAPAERAASHRLGVLWLAHGTTKKSMDTVCRRVALLHAAAHSQLRLIEGALNTYRDVFERAHAT